MLQTPTTDIYNQTLFDIIPPHLKKVVEIGTGSGALANAYKFLNPNVFYIGVEIDASYAELSKRFCDRVYVEDFQSPTTELMKEIQEADAIIFSDVLEHMFDPWSIISFLYDNVKDGCLILASIPNIQHWSIQIRLLQGDFDYSESGLLDRTHVRFFTKNGIEKLFINSGFSILSITPRIFDFPNQNLYLNWIRDNALKFNIDPFTATQCAAAFQFVVQAQK